MTSPKGQIFVHSSDEMYGADRMLLELVGAMPGDIPFQVWLPTDVSHSDNPLCVELGARGVEVRHLDLPILRRTYKSPFQLAKVARRGMTFASELRSARPETVYCTTSAAFIAAPIARAAGVPRVIGHVQEIWSRGDRRILAGPALACHNLLTISGQVAESLGPRLRERAIVVLNATPEPTAIVPLAGRTGPLRFIVASRWNGWKGHGTLLAAWDRLADPGHLVVLGGPPASGEAIDVPSVVAGMRRPDTVTVVGEVADPSTYLNDADIILVPSDRPEPFGLVAIEAFARGRPVVASAAGGLLDIVSEGANGWMFDPGDVDGLTQVLSSITRKDVVAAGIRARATYEAHFTTISYAARWRAAIA